MFNEALGRLHGIFQAKLFACTATGVSLVSTVGRSARVAQSVISFARDHTVQRRPTATDSRHGDAVDKALSASMSSKVRSPVSKCFFRASPLLLNLAARCALSKEFSYPRSQEPAIDLSLGDRYPSQIESRRDAR